MKQARISAIAHHSRNRLTGLIDRLERAGYTECTQELQEIAAQWAVVQALLRLEGDEAIQYFEVDLQCFCAELFAEARRLAPEGLELFSNQDFSQTSFPVWTFDAPLVKVVVLDALANAWRYASTRVELSCVVAHGRLHFSVRDDGPGFPDAMLRSGNPVLPLTSGTGQGLSLARKIAQGHVIRGQAGEVFLNNDQGAQFTLCLP